MLLIAYLNETEFSIEINFKVYMEREAMLPFFEQDIDSSFSMDFGTTEDV